MSLGILLDKIELLASKKSNELYGRIIKARDEHNYKNIQKVMYRVGEYHFNSNEWNAISNLIKINYNPIKELDTFEKLIQKIINESFVPGHKLWGWIVKIFKEHYKPHGLTIDNLKARFGQIIYDKIMINILSGK